ncbi:class I SAM-dependent methyltransferase [Nocardia halotolerans]|uniref:Class I SAM-dependent methyltransferase n=1 Tax=Nocardia halotolerans TaxID=1755878 RepID=A0ABV8VAS2_9NOCA
MELFDYDAELRRHNAHFRAAARVGVRDRVLDVGCGTGQTTREAARAAIEGSAVGVDVSEVMVEHARRISEEQGPANVSFQLADAQTHPFPPASFDLCISRFGTMFFADPVAAFTNIGRALRPGGRLVMLVWQVRDRNEWVSLLRPDRTDTVTAPGPGPFSLADPAATESVLAAAGFTEIGFTDVAEPVYYGPDSSAAYDNLLRLTGYAAFLDSLEPTESEHTRARVRSILADHQSENGVLFDSRAWIITADHSGT